MFNIHEWNKQANIVADILSRAPKIDKTLRVGKDEFQRRQKAVYQALKAAGFDGGIASIPTSITTAMCLIWAAIPTFLLSRWQVLWARTVSLFWQALKVAMWPSSCPPVAVVAWAVWRC